MTAGRIFVLGAGMAGLAAATRLAEAGRPVTVLETAPHAGGRCRSFFERTLDCEIDNGNHLVLSGNVDAMEFLARTGASDRVRTAPARYAFHDLARGAHWTVTLGRGPVPWWIFWPAKRIPDTRLGDYWRSRRLLDAGPEDTVADVLGDTGALYERFWRPLAIAILNTDPAIAAAALLKPVIAETLGRGGAYTRPVLAERGLGHAFVEPALAYLESKGGDVRFNVRVRALSTAEGRVTGIATTVDDMPVGPEDRVISALPPAVVADLLPGLGVPDVYSPIVNAHFKLVSQPDMAPITGFVGGLSEWLFIKHGIASVTVSAAAAAAEKDAAQLSSLIWREIAPIMGCSRDDEPPSKIVKEKRATIAQTPAMLKYRPSMCTEAQNLLLSGDWTDTGLPATIEGALRSGHRAAAHVLKT